uniref:Coiled-coil domain-containing protein 22 homolog n=1 Tax=Glossina brevipalpis TaxID=37001 RepID=A0A1A9WC94_9MUSC
MDEVDKIIIHSLKQIGCKLETDDEEGDDVAFGLQHFTPDLLVRAVSKCLQEINPTIAVPKSLPENMAQRFTVATLLAEMCGTCGYRGDIGYQTFLYPNVVDARRLFMFLIEHLPKELESGADAQTGEEKNDFILLMREIKQKIAIQLRAPWVPQYCRGVANRKTWGCSSQPISFDPQINLNIPDNYEGGISQSQRNINSVSSQTPNVFQQTAKGDHDLISSVLHKNSIDVYDHKEPSLESLRLCLKDSPSSSNNSNIRKTELSANVSQQQIISHKVATTFTPLEQLTQEVESLKLKNDEFLNQRQVANSKLNVSRQQHVNTLAIIEQLRKDLKIRERCCMVLENPDDNLGKLKDLIEKTKERRETLENQWKSHRQPALDKVNELQTLRQTKNLQNIQELRTIIKQLENTLKEKIGQHVQLGEELKKVSLTSAPRKEYTRRIHEFIGNIRKQRNDIYKILDDTRDLQKQLNSVSAQLERQFNYTDDLLFQSAKHDLHAKQAYKFLASLHAACNEICELVSQTGQTAKEIRDLEIQIDRERMRNIATSLEQITSDIRNFETVIKTMQVEIKQMENEITAG